MIGDRLDTDIEFGLNGGIDTLCVLTGKRILVTESVFGLFLTIFYLPLGITTKDKLLSPDNNVKSTYYIDSFGDFASKQ